MTKLTPPQRALLTAALAPGVFWLGNRVTGAKRPTIVTRPLEPRAGTVE